MTERRGHPILYALLGLVSGAALGAATPLAAPLARLLDWVVAGYARVAPAVLYLILAPSLLRLLTEPGSTRMPAQVRTALLWFVKARAAACLFAVAAVSALYRLPLVGRSPGGGVTSALDRSLGLMPGLFASSPYFYAIAAAVLTALVLRGRRGPWIQRFLRIPVLVESFGGLFTHVVPLFTLLMGAYIATLPAALGSRFAQLPPGRLSEVELLGLRLHAATPGGVFGVYLAIALSTGVFSVGWHLLLVAYTRARLGRELSVPFYLRHQFLRLYPLLWATCSEALATPLNLHLMKENYPQVRETVRHMAASLGSIFNVNGTMICCFTMIPVVSGLLGFEVSVASLLLSAPLIYLLGFAVPGIPGELVLFAGPVMKVLAIPPAVEPVFLAAFIGLQLGLPDAFRSGVNSTDNCLAALLVDHELDRSAA